MRTEAQTTSMSITTHYHVELYPALVAQHPTLFGVVATAPGTDGLVGVATAFTDQVRIGGRDVPQRPPREPQGPSRVPAAGPRPATRRVADRRGGPALRRRGRHRDGDRGQQRGVARDGPVVVDPDPRPRAGRHRVDPDEGSPVGRRLDPPARGPRRRGRRRGRERVPRVVRPLPAADRREPRGAARSHAARRADPPVPRRRRRGRRHRRGRAGQRAVQAHGRPRPAGPAAARAAQQGGSHVPARTASSARSSCSWRGTPPAAPTPRASSGRRSATSGATGRRTSPA